MDSEQFDALMLMLNDIRGDIYTNTARLDLINAELQSMNPSRISSSYAITTTLGVVDLQIQHTSSVGDLAFLVCFLLLLAYSLGRLFFNTIRGLGA